MALKMDSGDVLAQERIPIKKRETTASLSETFSYQAAEMLKPLMPQFLAGNVHAKPQQGEPVYCSLIAKEQGRIDWKLPAEEIDARVRACTPWPLCFTLWEGNELYILEGRDLEEKIVDRNSSPKQEETPHFTSESSPGSSEYSPGLVIGIDRVHGILIQTGNGIFAISRLQRRAKKALDWKAFIIGARDFIGSRLE
jgi:methionyl-tRNA formyltransferase